MIYIYILPFVKTDFSSLNIEYLPLHSKEKSFIISTILQEAELKTYILITAIIHSFTHTIDIMFSIAQMYCLISKFNYHFICIMYHFIYINYHCKQNIKRLISNYIICGTMLLQTIF